MIFDFLQKKDRAQKKAKQEERKNVRHAKKEKKEQERREKKAMRQAEKVEKERAEREKKFQTLDDLLKDELFQSQSVIAIRTVLVTVMLGTISHDQYIIEMITDSGKRHYLHNRIGETLEEKFLRNGLKKRCHFTPIPILEAREALKCIFPKFSSIKITDSDIYTLKSSTSPLNIEELTAISVNPRGANPSYLVLNQGLSVAKFWLEQKGKVCSVLKISDKTYAHYRARFEQQAEEFAREMVDKDNLRILQTQSNSTETVSDCADQKQQSGDPISVQASLEVAVEEKSEHFQSGVQSDQMKSVDVPDSAKQQTTHAENDDEVQRPANESPKCETEVSVSEEKLLEILKTLKGIAPFLNSWRNFPAFRMIYFKIGTRCYPTIQLIDADRYSINDILLYYDIPSEMVDNITMYFNPYGKASSVVLTYMPLDILVIEKVLSQVIPELNSYTVYVEKIGYKYELKKEKLTLGLLEPLKLIEPEKLLKIETDLSDWFFEVQRMWTSPEIFQLTRISFTEYSCVTTMYQNYENVHETLMQQARAKEEKKGKTAEKKERDRLLAEVEERRRLQEQKRAEQNAKIQQAGAEGEKRVDYVLECMGPDTIQVMDNTVNKYGKSSIMLKSEKWANIPQEVDHILIRENGVFLIETKNLSGKIEIDQSGNWIQTKEEKGQAPCAIESPTFQVYRHEKLVRSFLPEDVPVTSIICLANARVLVKGQENCKVPVLRWDLLAPYIEDLPSEKKLSRKEMEAIHEQIKAHYYEYSADDNT